MKTAIHIGPDGAKLKAALPEITKAILAVLNSPAGDDVKKAAISALQSSFTVQNTSIMNCNFSGTE